MFRRTKHRYNSINKRNILFGLVICFSISSFTCLAQVITTNAFDIVLSGKKIGNLTTTQHEYPSKTVYQSFASIKIKLVKDVEVLYTYDVAFAGVELQCSDVSITINKKPHAETQTEKFEEIYKVIKGDELALEIREKIIFSSIQLYFKEPENIKQCYSEQQGNFSRVVPLKKHTYKVINARGLENIYHYESGLLKRIEVKSGLIDFEIITALQ